MGLKHLAYALIGIATVAYGIASIPLERKIVGGNFSNAPHAEYRYTTEQSFITFIKDEPTEGSFYVNLGCNIAVDPNIPLLTSISTSNGLMESNAREVFERYGIAIVGGGNNSSLTKGEAYFQQSLIGADYAIWGSTTLTRTNANAMLDELVQAICP